MTKLGKVTHSLDFLSDSLPEVEGTSLRSKIWERSHSHAVYKLDTMCLGPSGTCRHRRCSHSCTDAVNQNPRRTVAVDLTLTTYIVT